MKPPIQSTNTSLRKFVKKFFDFASLGVARMELGVEERSWSGETCLTMESGSVVSVEVDWS